MAYTLAQQYDTSYPHDVSNNVGCIYASFEDLGMEVLLGDIVTAGVLLETIDALIQHVSLSDPGNIEKLQKGNLVSA